MRSNAGAAGSERQHRLRRLAFQWVGKQQHDHFVVHGQCGPAIGRDRGDAGRVCQHDQPRTRAQQPARMVQRHFQPCVVVRRLGIPAHQRIEHAQCPPGTGGGRHRRFLRRSAQRRNAVAIAHRDPCRHRTRARGLHRLETDPRAEVQRGSGIGDHQGQPLAFGLEQLGVRLAAACGEPPVDVASVVALRVLARLGVLHAPPAEWRQRMPAVAVQSALRRTPAQSQTPQGDQFRQGGRDSLSRLHGFTPARAAQVAVR